MPKGEANKITEVTRRYIIDALLLDREPFYGRLDLVGFLRRVWPLKDMPSTDGRFEDAEGDIWKHMVANDDWTTDYLFYNRLDVLDMPDEGFAKFLEESVHPLVSTGAERTARLVSLFNGYLNQDGVALRPNRQVSGHKLYKVVSTTGAGALAEAYEVVLSFAGEDREYVGEVAELLKANDVSLFYDMYEEATLWGKDLVEHLHKVRRNLWVTDTLQWWPEARLAQPANPMRDSAASAFAVRSQLPFESVCPLRSTLRR